MVKLTSPAATEAQRRARRRERLADAARLLPALGLILFLLPDLILSGGPQGQGATAPWLNYLFAAWILLIVLALWIARRHARVLDEAEDGPKR